MPASPSHRWLWLDIAAVVIASSLIGTWFLLNQPSTELRPKKAKAQQDEAVPKLVAEAIAAKQPNVVFIVLDTVRADHLSICDYDRPTSPNLAAFVASARN